MNTLKELLTGIFILLCFPITLLLLIYVVVMKITNYTISQISHLHK